MASHKGYKTTVGRGVKPIVLQPGQFVSGSKKLSSEIGVPITTIKRIISVLKVDHQIDIEKTRQGSVFTIINWGQYQWMDTEVDHERTTNGPPVDPIQEVKNVKNVKNNKTYSVNFEKFWSAYPRKMDKKKAYAAWKKLNGVMPDIDTLVATIETQKKSDQWMRDIIPLPTTWLNGNRWEDVFGVKTHWTDKE